MNQFVANFVFVSLMVFRATVFASEHAELPVLGNASGGDCALNRLVFDKDHKRGTSRKHFIDSATPILNDHCELEENVFLIADGHLRQLPRVGGKLRVSKRLTGSRLRYSDTKFTVDLEIGRLIESYPDPDTQCQEDWYRVLVHVTDGDHKRVIHGTLTGECP
jgi:hypothetical protein